MSNQEIDKLSIKRHSLAHVMAEAVLELFPQAKLAIGPAIKDGFYYDFDLPRTLTNDDLEVIEEKMKVILKTHSSFDKKVISREESLNLFKDQDYKLDDDGLCVPEKDVTVTNYNAGPIAIDYGSNWISESRARKKV